MKVYVLTDMEGVAGVINFDDYVGPEGRYYETGRELTTLETSAAVQGLLDGGATEIHVLDGHGSGAIRLDILHPAAKLIAGRPLTYPFGLDSTFDAMVVVGQHSKAGTPTGHLCHTGDLLQIDCTLNGQSVGELGLDIAFAGYFGVPCIMVAGDQACCDEARALLPQVETVAVKRGLNRGAAIHLHPDRARALIRDRAWQAIGRVRDMEPFRPAPPYELVSVRPSEDGKDQVRKVVQGDDLLEVLRQVWG